MDIAERQKLDQQILDALRERSRAATYVIRNVVADHPGRRGLKTSQVLRRLRVMERWGYVEQAPTDYAVMLSWKLRTTPATASEGA
jgi:DNA-binding IclR family transcriptional regulator